jgi:hypothetical protein
MSDGRLGCLVTWGLTGVWGALIAARVGVLIWASTLLLRSGWTTRDDPAWCSPSLAASMATLVIVHWVATTCVVCAEGTMLGMGVIEAAKQDASSVPGGTNTAGSWVDPRSGMTIHPAPPGTSVVRVGGVTTMAAPPELPRPVPSALEPPGNTHVRPAHPTHYPTPAHPPEPYMVRVGGVIMMRAPTEVPRPAPSAVESCPSVQQWS